MFEPGQVVGQYRLERTLHRGTTTVFAAVDLSSGQDVAVKVFGEGIATDPDRRAQFVAEVERAMTLPKHRRIVEVLGWGQWGTSMYLVSELVDGENLATVMARQLAVGPMATGRVLSILDNTADALDFGHQHGAVHGSFRPGNVLLRCDGESEDAVVLGFGIPRRVTTASGFGGGANYVAPEQVAGTELPSRRTDIYAFGCVVFELLAGRPPYGGAPTEVARVAAHLQAAIPSVHALRPDLPESVDRVVAKALHKDRDSRH